MGGRTHTANYFCPVAYRWQQKVLWSATMLTLRTPCISKFPTAPEQLTPFSIL